MQQDNIDLEMWFCKHCKQWKESYNFANKNMCIECRSKDLNKRIKKENRD